VSIESRVSYVLVAAMFLTQAIMFWLQFKASMRHRQRSFAFLWVSTLCGALYLLLNIVPIKMHISANMDAPIFYASSLLLVAQMTLGVWGTAELFKAYRRLDTQASEAAGINA